MADETSEPGRKVAIEPVAASQTDLTAEEQAELLNGVKDPFEGDYDDERMGWGNFWVTQEDGARVLHVEFTRDDNAEEHGDRAGEKWEGRWLLSYLGGTARPHGFADAAPKGDQ